MERQGTSTILQYVRTGDVVTPFAVQRAWYRGQLVETARWRVPWSSIRREVGPPGALGYGREDLLAGGVIKPSLHELDGLPYLPL